VILQVEGIEEKPHNRYHPHAQYHIATLYNMKGGNNEIRCRFKEKPIYKKKE